MFLSYENIIATIHTAVFLTLAITLLTIRFIIAPTAIIDFIVVYIIVCCCDVCVVHNNIIYYHLLIFYYIQKKTRKGGKTWKCVNVVRGTKPCLCR